MEKRKRPVPSSLFSVGKRALTPSPSCRYRRPQRITPPLKGLAMKFFVDTADIKDITELAATGLLDGVTTNPTLIHKSGRRFVEVVERSEENTSELQSLMRMSYAVFCLKKKTKKHT